MSAGRAAIGLVEQLPRIAAGGGACLGPLKLDVDLIAERIVSGDGSAVERLRREGGDVTANHRSGAAGEWIVRVVGRNENARRRSGGQVRSIIDLRRRLRRKEIVVELLLICSSRCQN